MTRSDPVPGTAAHAPYPAPAGALGCPDVLAVSALTAAASYALADRRAPR